MLSENENQLREPLIAVLFPGGQRKFASVNCIAFSDPSLPVTPPPLRPIPLPYVLLPPPTPLPPAFSRPRCSIVGVNNGGLLENFLTGSLTLRTLFAREIFFNEDFEKSAFCLR